MSVFVDNMRAPFGRMIMCHMVSRDLDELHEMADRIGVKRKWFQGDHYDISLTKRRLAVEHGAKECTRREAAHIVMVFRKNAGQAAARRGATFDKTSGDVPQ